MSSPLNLPQDLPERIDAVLRGFLDAAQEAFGADLLSAVLFGSAAEGRMRATSDLNVILVLRQYLPDEAIRLAGPLSIARAAVLLQVMFLLESEIPAAAECFAQKFTDIQRRRHVLLGPDPFAAIEIPRDAAILQTRQVLLNLTMRLRDRYALHSAQPDVVLSDIADSVGPLRTCAAAILELEGAAPDSPRESFARLISLIPAPDCEFLPSYLSALRKGAAPAEPKPSRVLEHILVLAAAMRHRVEGLR
ncbi:MAG: hypothetical protein ACKV22_25060 [Bryobacteraceae bacterium]